MMVTQLMNVRMDYRPNAHTWNQETWSGVGGAQVSPEGDLLILGTDGETVVSEVPANCWTEFKVTKR